jgi:GAF domain-containing protein
MDFGNLAEFDALAQSVQAKLNCKLCLVSLANENALIALGHSMVDTPAAERLLPVRDTLCAYTVLRGAPLRVPDVTKDPIFRNMPTVAAMGISAYIGVPLRLSGGEVVGAMCGLSSEPRIWTQGEVDYMLAVADLAESKIERHILRYEQKALSVALAETDAILSVLSELRDRALTVQNETGDLVFVNLALRTKLGLSYRDVLRLPRFVASVAAKREAQADVVLEVLGKPDLALHVEVSAVKSGLIMADWTLLNS